MRSVPLARPDIQPEDHDAVLAVLAAGMLVQGPQVARFEAQVAALCGRQHAVAVSSGTAALSLALQALEMQPGDEVLCPALSWPSPAHVVAARGGGLRFVDVDPAEWNASGAAFAAARTPQSRFAIAIDQFGMPCQRQTIEAATTGLRLIEDAACALGSHFPGSPCGSLGLISCLSFHPRKIITTGEGGMCLCDDAALAQRLRQLRNHGQAQPGVFVEAAGNFRMTDMQAALGLAQLTRLPGQIETRQRLAARYRAALPELDFQKAPAGATSNVQTLGVRWPTSVMPTAELQHRLHAQGVSVGPLSYALATLPSLQAANRGGPCPEAEALAREGLALPLYVQMDTPAQDQVIAGLKQALHAGPQALEHQSDNGKRI
ncbi:MAG: DegT/DnrJ/EryC1/StrS family aminotransferase [Polyangiales bacterium]